MDEMKFVVEICPLLMEPSRNDAISSPVSELSVPFLPPTSSRWMESRFVRAKFISPWGNGTWKNGNRIGRASAPNFNEWLPVVIATFWIKSQTLLYSFVGSQSLAPTLAVAPQAELRQPAVQAGGRVIAANANCCKFIRVGIGAAYAKSPGG